MGDRPDLGGGLGSRTRALDRLADSAKDPLDLLVVGGGITGAGIALDASARDMTVGLVDRYDFASGTSSKSSKLVHGGLRYLEQREFGLVREASTERDLLARLAPHLVEPIPFVIPISNRWRRAMFGVGLWTYDALASFKNMKVHRYIDVEETERLVPPLPKGKLQGGYTFFDSRTDDVRLVMEVLIQARRHGAAVANYAEVTGLAGGREGVVAQVLDTVGGSSFEVRAKRAVVAAGVWSDKVEALAGATGGPRLRPSKGIHLLFRRDEVPLGESAAFIPDAERKRMLFVIPWLDAVLVGTTDTPYDGDIEAPAVDPEDRTYCLDALNAAFDLGLKDEHIAGAIAGLRPLVAGKAGATADLSRRHAVYDIAPGIIGITGGKLTTYRRMAKDAVDRVARDLGVEAKSRTQAIRLGSASVAALRAAVERRATRLGITPVSVGHLIRCYGERAMNVLDLAESAETIDPLVEDYAPLAIEATYCARAEMAVRLADLLSRRTRLSLIDPAAGVGERALAADLMSREHGWSVDERTAEVDHQRRTVEHERGLSIHGPISSSSAPVG